MWKKFKRENLSCLKVRMKFLCLTRGVVVVRPAGLHAAAAVGERVYAFGVPPQGSEEGGGQADALQGLHHERMVSFLRRRALPQGSAECCHFQASSSP